MIVCHNVLEYIDNREEILKEFERLLKEDGVISVVKHDKAGKIMQKVVSEYNVEEALKLLDYENIESANFSMIDEYDDNDLISYSKGKLTIMNNYGVRMLYALQRNEIKTNPEWKTKMFEIECRAEQVSPFRDIAFFHHILLRHK